MAPSTTPGAATVYIASSVAGTVTLAVAPTDPTITDVSTTGSLTVDPAGINDVSGVAFTNATQNAFTDKTVKETVTVRNAQGDPVIATPVVNVTAGPNTDVPVTVLPTRDGKGNEVPGTYTATYPAGATAGTDTVEAFVNQTNHATNTAGLDSGEPSGTASVTVAAEHLETITGTDSISPVDITSVPVTFTLTPEAGFSAAGYSVDFTQPTGDAAKYTLSQSTGVTDANGKVSVKVTAAKPLDGDVATITATLVVDDAKTAPATVTWNARKVDPSNVVIAPFANTAPTKGSVTHTVTATDQFGDPVSGLTYTWTVGGLRNGPTTNPNATGSGASFTYTDTGVAPSAGSDTVNVTASTTSGDTTAVLGSDTVDQYWVPGTAKAAQANIDVSGSFLAKLATSLTTRLSCLRVS